MKKIINKIGIIFFMALVLGVLSCSSVFAATHGDVLNVPDAGWQRYNCIDRRFSFTSGWVKDPTYKVDDIGDFAKYTYTKTANVQFSFYGSKIRLIGAIRKYKRPDNIIKIDGVNYSFSEQDLSKDTSVNSSLVFEKQDLDMKIHTVVIYSPNLGGVDNGEDLVLGAVDIDDSGFLIDSSAVLAKGITLNKTTDSIYAGQIDTLIATIIPDNVTTKGVIWSSSDITIATVDSNGNIKGINPGTAIITASTIDGTNLSAKCTVTVNDIKPTLDITSEKSKVNGGDTFTTYAALHNVANIYAEDVIVSYDSNLFDFVSADVAKTGYEILNQETTTPGAIRFIVANKGADNGITGESQILKLTFKAKNISGKGRIEPSYGLIANGLDGTEIQPIRIGTEVEVAGYDVDVNKDGKYSLADLAIDARHYNMDKSKWNNKFNVDVLTNGQVDEEDLKAIVEAIVRSLLGK